MVEIDSLCFPVYQKIVLKKKQRVMKPSGIEKNHGSFTV